MRELEHTVQTLVATGNEMFALAAIRTALKTTVHNGKTERLSLKQAARAASRHAERGLILNTLSRTRWNRKRAAQELQISYKALLYKLKQIGIQETDSGFSGAEEWSGVTKSDA